MGTFGQGVTELGDPKVKKYFQNFPMLFQAGNEISRFFMTKTRFLNEWLGRFRRAIPHSTRN